MRAYDAMARRVVEAHGGVMQRFEGEAVTAVFGVPTVHEDDAERAVRAGLALVEQAGAFAGSAAGPCEARVGVHTGEALVQLDVDPAPARASSPATSRRSRLVCGRCHREAALS